MAGPFSAHASSLTSWCPRCRSRPEDTTGGPLAAAVTNLSQTHKQPMSEVIKGDRGKYSMKRIHARAQSNQMPFIVLPNAVNVVTATRANRLALYT